MSLVGIASLEGELGEGGLVFARQRSQEAPETKYALQGLRPIADSGVELAPDLAFGQSQRTRTRSAMCVAGSASEALLHERRGREDVRR